MRINTLKGFAQEESKFEWLVEDLIPKGNWTYFVGSPGVGKSIMALQMLVAISEGKPFLGLQTTQQNCLYVQCDEGEGEWQEQVRMVGNDSDAFTGYNLPQGWLTDEKERKNLKLILEGKHSQANRITKGVPFGFVIFDSLRSMAPGADTQNAIAVKALEWLKEICQTRTEDQAYYATTFILIHNTKKDQVRSINAGAGWGGFASDCGAMLTLAGTMLAREKGRVKKNRQIMLQRGDNGLWYPEVEKKQPKPKQTKIESLEDLEKLYPELSGGA